MRQNLLHWVRPLTELRSVEGATQPLITTVTYRGGNAND